MRLTRLLTVAALILVIGSCVGSVVFSQDTRATPTYRRIKRKLDAIPAIDTHDHLFPFDRLPCIEETKRGRGVNLAGLWHDSYYRRFNPLAPWMPGMDFDEWWQTAKHDFKDARATSFYRYQLPAFQDLYGVDFDQITDVPRERAEKAFGHRQAALTSQQIKDFEDFIMWRLCELSAKYELPFQIHTGDARIQGSNPMLLVDLIQANPKTRFILFHGGYPWIGETGAIVMHHVSNVWIDSCWLPTISYTIGKRAYHEWLEVMPSNHIMWGADCNHAEGIYVATEFTRRCLAEVLAEKIDRGDLTEAQADRIGRQILRDNALELFPQLKSRLWKQTGRRLQPP